MRKKVEGYVDASWRLSPYQNPLDAALADGDLLSEDAAVWKPKDFDLEEENDLLGARLQIVMQECLTKRERKVIANRVFGLSYEEIAVELKTASSTVKGILEVARKKIKKALEK